jgi:hypothetical protein
MQQLRVGDSTLTSPSPLAKSRGTVILDCALGFLLACVVANLQIGSLLWLQLSM